MKKATHNGTCQVCGRLQAVKGVLAKHGYTVKMGWFMGTCPGSGRLPLEVSRELADQVVFDLHSQAANLTRDVEKIDAGTLRPEFVATRFLTRNREGKTVAIEVMFHDATEYQQADGIKSLRWNKSRRAELAAMTARDIAARADAITGKVALRERAAA